MLLSKKAAAKRLPLPSNARPQGAPLRSPPRCKDGLPAAAVHFEDLAFEVGHEEIAAVIECQTKGPATKANTVWAPARSIVMPNKSAV
jgi:hypothetical protein